MGNHLKKLLCIFSNSTSQDEPLSQPQTERWDELHYLLKEYWGGNFSAPIHEWLRIGDLKVLDMG